MTETSSSSLSTSVKIPNFTPRDYGAFFAAGVLGSRSTPAFKNIGFLGGTRQVIAKEGASALLTGFGPTADTEYWKRVFSKVAGSDEAMVKYRTSSVAEFFADILLTPLEATRIRLVSERGYATGLVSGFTRMAREGGLRELYAGFVPILFKQIPFAIGQFTVNEWCHEVVARSLSEETRRNLTHTSELGISLGCGVVAGFSAAVLSHPADTLLSQINKGKGSGGSMLSRMRTIAGQIGFRGLFAGLGPRMVMTAGLVSSQFKSLGAPKGVEIHKKDN
ncbi:mitochondrial carrier [Flagelloscypha sp. PMI_526]|nr:mitochondrial carrier [Flagelloscypha sp. PMI_526]